MEVICLMILFAWISFFPAPSVHPESKEFIISRIVLGLFLFTFVLIKKYRNHLFSLRDWPFWLFMVCLASGIFSATDKVLARDTYIYLAVTFFLIFFIGKAIMRNNENKTFVFAVICVCSGIVAAIGFLEFIFGKNILYENFIQNPFYERYIRYSPRLMSTQLNPAILGSYLVGCLPFNFYFIKNKALHVRLLSIFCTLLCSSVIVLTFSRGAFLGLIGVLLFYLWKMQKKRLIAIIISFLFLAMTICSLQRNINFNRFGFKRLLVGSYDSVISQYRADRIKMTTRILKDHPFFGIGFNHFRIRFKEYCDKKNINETYEFMIPDNMYLTFLAETGIVGTGGFLVFISVLLKRAFRKLRNAKGDNKLVLLTLLCALIGLLVNMGGYDLFYWNNPYMLLCLNCGFIQSLIGKASEV